MRGARTTLLVWLSLCAGGCALMKDTGQRYETIRVAPQHDTESARKKTDSAVHDLHHGHLEKAEELLQEALVADVNYGPAHNNLGHLYYHIGKLYLAAWEFEYASRLMRNRPEPLYNLGLVYEMAHRWEEAIASYEAALAMDPENYMVLANLARARIYTGERSLETARLLREIEFRDERTDWRLWAREQLNTTHLELLPLVQSTVVPAACPPDGEPTPVPAEDYLPEPGPLLPENETVPQSESIPEKDAIPEPDPFPDDDFQPVPDRTTGRAALPDLSDPAAVFGPGARLPTMSEQLLIE